MALSSSPMVSRWRARERVELLFKLENSHDSRQVDAFIGQPLDPLEQRDVTLGVPARVPRRSLRPEQSLAFVDAKGLRVNTGQLGRNRNHVDSSILLHTVGHLDLPQDAFWFALFAKYASRSLRGLSL